ncbi:MAG: phage tail sheath family protein, partial [Microcoleus sp. SIO2G3]|nr:phage tail sheath family protein [Microcoleus sp. SIO2G3]
CIPPFERGTDVSNETYAAAVSYCLKRRAMLIVDAPSTWTSIAQAEAGVDTVRSALGGEKIARNAAIFFPRLKMADALKENRTEEFAPCGVVAGIFARTDATRGVWKAPAGTEAGILGIRELSYKMTDGENGRLNPKGLNCIRFFRDYGNVIWGSRTLAGSDSLASEWKYVPVRRLALFLEESLYRGTQWVVFEPNDEPLWAQIRLNIGAFMNNLFRQGAFQGKTPREAYFVKCDKETTTQNDIDRGIVNIIVGFAPLKPAEFVIIKFQQIAGQIQT